MHIKVNGVSRTEYIGFRVSPIVKKKIEKYAKENGFSVGELVTLGVLLHIDDKREAGTLLIKKETERK